MTRTKHHTITLHGAEGTGPTAAAAKAHAIRRIETAFADPYNNEPIMTRFPDGLMGLVFRRLDGWCYDLIRPDTTRRICYGLHTGLLSAQLADKEMRRTAAQDAIFTTEDQGKSLLQAGDTDGLREHQRYVQFQLAYRRHAAEGKSHDQCHRLACEASWAA